MYVDMPVPPPFMWACPRCTGLLDDLAVAAALTMAHDFHDAAARCQLILAHHLAREHTGEIPEPHKDCERCTFFEQWSEDHGMDDLWAEHLARGLFLPESVARHF